MIISKKKLEKMIDQAKWDAAVEVDKHREEEERWQRLERRVNDLELEVVTFRKVKAIDK